MNSIYFASSNQEKIQIAQTVCAEANISVQPIGLEIDEIQGEDSEAIVRDKVRRAYEQVDRPVIVTDETWDIPSLRGFPGAYMKSINQWFMSRDFLRLMQGITDRRIVLCQYLAYTDGVLTKVFRNDMPGQIINEARGTNDKSPSMTVIALDCDNGKTIAEVFEQGTDAVIARHKNQPDVWHEFLSWYKSI